MATLYIDPMSGVAIVNLIIAIVLAMWRQIIKLLSLLTGKKHIKEVDYKEKYSDFSILNEGNQYYSTFLPIIQEFEKEKICVNYFTLDINDKLLRYESNYFRPKFLGFSTLGIYNASKIKTKFLLCTTPNIGNKNYPLKKPKNTKNLIHVFHSVSDISIYRKGSLDFYDIVFLGSSFQLKSIREIEKFRNLNTKKCFEVGFPYLDFLIKSNIKNYNNSTQQINVLIASSWGKKGLLNSFDDFWIKKLVKQPGLNVVIRPHPQSYKSEKKMILKIQELAKKYNNILIDKEESPIESMQNASVLISDTSSIRYDYAFIFLKPVITVNIDADNMKEYEFDLLTKKWDYEVRNNIGPIIDNVNEISAELISDIVNSKNDYKEKIIKLRSTSIPNLGKSSSNVVKKIINIDKND